MSRFTYYECRRCGVFIRWPDAKPPTTHNRPDIQIQCFGFLELVTDAKRIATFPPWVCP